MSLTSPLRRALGLGAAKEGVSHWWAQRVSAVALVLLALWLMVSFVALADFGHARVSAWLHAPWNAVIASLLLMVGAYHSLLGVQVVVEDYVQHPWIKIVTLLLLTFLHVALAAVGVFAVLYVALA